MASVVALCFCGHDCDVLDQLGDDIVEVLVETVISERVQFEEKRVKILHFGEYTFVDQQLFDGDVWVLKVLVET